MLDKKKYSSSRLYWDCKFQLSIVSKKNCQDLCYSCLLGMLRKRRRPYYRCLDYSFQLNIEYRLRLPYWSYSCQLGMSNKKKLLSFQHLDCNFQLNIECK